MKSCTVDYTRGAGGPQGLVSNHLKSGGNEEDGGNLLKRISDVRFSLFGQIMKIKPLEIESQSNMTN